ncbi:hypothetical protein Dda_8140 [Drechslerella dactyloides]|uniref:C3H1-type domain-containing protein n=1 Tax=Drechslerella dactyloides TaxID=74499 RepID=A0AAD6IUX2_DREDA|nr:hypothetical protein Dda_8140 [Drechslerella dactyloides]
MTRPSRSNNRAKNTSEMTIPPDSKMYPYYSRIKQTPIRSMLMAHGCCFDYFEKTDCKAGNDCKYSHLAPGDVRNLIMDSEHGLRKKKYYRPETLQTYLPGSQDVICFTFARKGWCIHGDKCWNQHISPPQDIYVDSRVPGLTTSATPSPVSSELPTIDTGYLYPAAIQTQTQAAFAPHNPWSNSTLTAGQSSTSQHTYTNEHLIEAAAKGNCTLYCKPDPLRTAAANWRVPNHPVAAVQAPRAIASPIEVPVMHQPEPVRTALNFNWSPVIKEAPRYKWRKTTVDAPTSKPVYQAPVGSLSTDTTLANINNTAIDFNYSSVELTDEAEFDLRKYRLGVPLSLGRGHPEVPMYR